MSTSLLETAAARWLGPKTACVLVLGLVFLAGAGVGALVVDYGIHNPSRSAVFDTLDGRTAYFERVQKDLDLTPAQAAQMQSILDDFWQYYRTVLSDGKQRIEQVLSPAQKVKFERLLQEQQKK